LGFVPRGQADESDHAIGGAEDACDDQAGDAAHGNPRLVEARAKVMRRAKIFEQRGCADHMNFPAPIETMLRGHFI
jgi:hypothetical protein